MLLSSEDIRHRLRSTDPEQRLRITPLDPADIQPASVDLHLGSALLIASPEWEGWKPFDLSHGSVSVRPGQFVLGHTVEYIGIPPTLAGEMVGKSSRAREGWVVEAAGYFDPGWLGRGTVELSSRWPGERVLTLGMPICQMRFHVLTSRPQRLYGDDALQSHYFVSETVQRSYLDSAPIHPTAVEVLHAE